MSLTSIGITLALAAISAWLMRSKSAAPAKPLPKPILANSKEQRESVPESNSFESIMLLKKRLKLGGATPQEIHAKLDPLILQLLDDPLDKPATVAAAAESPAAKAGAK